jgi:hypothetical protein
VSETERMPNLIVGDAELDGGGKSKICNSFSKPNFETLPKPLQVREVGLPPVRRVKHWFMGFAFMEHPKN